MNTFKAFIILFSVVFLSGCFDIPPPPPPPIVGTWTAKISAQNSNCRNIRRGDVYTEQWNVNFINRQVTVRAVGSSTGVKAYEGGYIGYDKVRLNSVGSVNSMEMELTQDGLAFRGDGMLKTSKGSCNAYCTIELTKQ